MLNPLRTDAPTPKLVLLLALGLFALGGCSEDDDPTAPPAPTNVTSAQDGDLRLSVATDKASYSFGEAVTITTTLTNTGSAPVALDFERGSPPRYSNLNVNVNDGDGVSHHTVGEGTADRTTLAPGASITHGFVWDQVSRRTREPVTRGFFEVTCFSGFDTRETLAVRDLFIELK